MTRVFLFVVLVWILGSCDLGGGSSGQSISFQELRSFNAQTLTNGWITLNAHLRYQGSRCLVYVEEGESQNIPDTIIQQIGREFDEKVYSVVSTYFGEKEDVDRNDRVILLLLDIKDGYTEGSSGGYVAGYFDATHMYSRRTRSMSNEADMLFLDTFPGLLNALGAVDLEALVDLKITMAHEFQHLVNFSENVIRQRTPPMDTWIDEGLATGAEYLYLGSHVQWKIDYFNQKQYQGIAYDPLRDANLWGQHFVSWRQWGDILVNYSTVYLFFQWLRIQAGGSSIYRRIIEDPASDYTAVVSAFNAATGITWTWREIFRTWLIANILNEPTGWHGYQHQLTDSAGRVRYLYPRFFHSISSNPQELFSRGQFPPFSAADGTANILPGDAVYVKLQTTKELMDTGSLVYGSVNLTTGAEFIGTGNYAAGDILIVGNTVGRFDGTVYQTPTLVDSGVSTIVGISDRSPPQASFRPRGAAFDTNKSSRTRPYPVGALLGTDDAMPAGGSTLR